MTNDMRRLAKQVEGLAPQLDDKQLLEQIVVTIDYLWAKWDRHSPLFRSSDPEDVIHARRLGPSRVPRQTRQDH
jgi:hypothetical protein